MSGIYRGPNGSAIADALNIDGDKGDITISNSGLDWAINTDAVTFAKMQNISTDSLLGRSTASTGNVEEIPCTAAGRALLDDANAAAQRTTLGLGSAATGTIGTDVLAYDANLQGFVDTFTLPTTDSTSGFVLGTNGLGTLAFISPPAFADGDYGDISVSGGGTIITVDNSTITTDKLVDDNVTYAKIQNVSATDRLLGRSTAGAGNIEEITCTSAGRALLDDADASAQRTTLGLGTIATQASSNVTITGGSITGITALSIADGGTGASTAAAAFTNLKQAASDTATGVVELLTSAEYVTGTDTTRVLTASVARARNIVPGTMVTASGTSVDFSSIPSWAKRITVMFNSLSTNGTSNIQVQIGDSGGIENTGYSGAESTAVGASSATFSAGFVIKSGVLAANNFSGVATLFLMDSATNTWAFRSNAATGNSTQVGVAAGVKSLTATLDRVRLTTANGTDTFDTGSVNILYE